MYVLLYGLLIDDANVDTIKILHCTKSTIRVYGCKLNVKVLSDKDQI